MPKTFIAYNGSVHPVREDHLIFLDDHDHNEEAEAILRWKMTAPLDQPWRRQDAALTDRQKKYLEAWTNRNNMNSALAYLRGYDYRVLGFETLCQVHGNLHSFPCGCKLHIIIDHHKRHVGYVDADIKPLRAEFVCPEHAGKRYNDMDSLYWAAARASRVD